VDNEFNIYTKNSQSRALQKWLPGAETPINLFEERFANSPLFYHSMSRSLYFFYTLQQNPGVYKLVDESLTPVIVINSDGQGSDLNKLSNSCTGLYVNSAGDIFILDRVYNRIVKWMVNATSGILVVNTRGSDSNTYSIPSAFVVDEINNVIYVLYTSNYCIVKFTNGSANGVTIFGGGPNRIFSDVVSEYTIPQSVLVDKMGNILVGEVAKITKWTPDIKFNVIVADIKNINSPKIMVFDRLENLYVFDSANNQVVKFIRNATSCAIDSD
jgi:hypothetical protein